MDVACCLDQILEFEPNQNGCWTAFSSLINKIGIKYAENYSPAVPIISCSSFSYIWTHLCKPSSRSLLSSAQCGNWVPSRGLTKWDGQLELIERVICLIGTLWWWWWWFTTSHLVRILKLFIVEMVSSDSPILKINITYRFVYKSWQFFFELSKIHFQARKMKNKNKQINKPTKNEPTNK